MFQGNTIVQGLRPTDLNDETRVNMQIAACQLVALLIGTRQFKLAPDDPLSSNGSIVV